MLGKGNGGSVAQNRASGHLNTFSASSVSCCVDIFRVLDGCEAVGASLKDSGRSQSFDVGTSRSGLMLTG